MAAKFEKGVEAIPEEMRVYWRYHRVENGETLSDIARRYHTTATAIAEANNLEGTELLAQNSKLIIPVSPAKAAAPSEAASRSAAPSYSKRPAHYTVRKGDTVLSVADDFGVPAEKVRQWNRLQGNTLRAGRSLTIFKPADGAVVERTAAAGNRRGLSTRSAHAKPQPSAHSETRSSSGSRHKATSERQGPAEKSTAVRSSGSRSDRRKTTAEAPAAKSTHANGVAKTAHSGSRKHKQRG
jgi:membrane-bound lytic murein transglycosylase D